MSSSNMIHYVDDAMLLTLSDVPELRFRLATDAIERMSSPYESERERLTTRAIQLGVTPDTFD